MATITVRNLPDSVVRALKELAERNNRSMEQEAREIISSRVMDRGAVMKMLRDGWDSQARAVRMDEADEWARQSRAWRK
jgi:plasmid stability protein